jgi:hypothetical protein
VTEPVGGAHLDYAAASRLVDAVLARHLAELERLPEAARLEGRYDKFRHMGRLGQSFTDDGPAVVPPAAPPEGLPETPQAQE